MKKIIALLITVSLCVTLCSCNSSIVTTIKGYLGQETVVKPEGYVETKENDLYVYDVFKTHITLIEYKGEETNVVTPVEIEGKPVTVIGSSCFYGNTSMVTLIVSEGVEIIENAAFYYCTSLKKARLPESCTAFGEKLFSWCTSLESITLPSGMKSVPDYGFNYCSALTEIVWNTTVTHIGIRAFSWCTSLTNLTLPQSVLTIDNYAFSNCGTLQSVTIPVNTVYPQNAFDMCDNATVSGGVQKNSSDTSQVSE